MPNNGTGYDKYCKGWWDEGDPAYSRRLRNEYAIKDSILSNEWDEPDDEDCPLDCIFMGTNDEDYYCVACRPSMYRRTVEAKKLAAHREKPKHKPKHLRTPRRYRVWNPKRQKLLRDLHTYYKNPWIRLEAPKETPVLAPHQHAWVEREKWVASHNDRWGYRRSVGGPEMVLHRIWVCLECRAQRDLGAVTVRPDLTKPPKHRYGQRWRWYGRSSQRITRPMTVRERAEWDKQQAKNRKWDYSPIPVKDQPAPYGRKDDGTPLTRIEFKQAPKKRAVRKREDEDPSS